MTSAGGAATFDFDNIYEVLTIKTGTGADATALPIPDYAFFNAIAEVSVKCNWWQTLFLTSACKMKVHFQCTISPMLPPSRSVTYAAGTTPFLVGTERLIPLLVLLQTPLVTPIHQVLIGVDDG